MRITRPTLARTPVTFCPARMPFLFTLTLLLSLGPVVDGQGEPPGAESMTASDSWCATQRMFEMQAAPYASRSAAGCPIFGSCDIPTTRNANIPPQDFPLLVINLIFHIVTNDDGGSPATTPSMIAAQVANLNQDFASSRITFEYDYDYINRSAYRSLTESEFDQMKAAYAVKPDSLLNVYISYVEGGFSFGTFPWDQRSQSVYGGVIMTKPHFDYVQSTLAHEIGHCLGLMHTQRGVSEVTKCSDCYERAGYPDGDLVGDFCEDTDPTPTNTSCNPPGGTDQCSGNSWGPTHVENFMGYSGEPCWSEFSPQQMGRMHCWINSALLTWTTGVRFTATNTFGVVPLPVAFNGVSAKTVSAWQWDFGDGETSNQQSPLHTYTQPGIFDVRLAIQSTDGPYEFISTDMVWAHADTLRMGTAIFQPNWQVHVDVLATNYLPVNELVVPFSWEGPANLILDSISLAGLRTEYMKDAGYLQYDPNGQRATYRLAISESVTQYPLPPGSGPIMRLFFRTYSVPTANPLNIISYSTIFGTYSPTLTAAPGSYSPVALSGGVATCLAGDVNNDGSGPDLSDLATLISYLVGTGVVLPNPKTANVDGKGVIDISDLALLIAYLMASANLPPCG